MRKYLLSLMFLYLSLFCFSQQIENKYMIIDKNYLINIPPSWTVDENTTKEAVFRNKKYNASIVINIVDVKRMNKQKLIYGLLNNVYLDCKKTHKDTIINGKTVTIIKAVNSSGLIVNHAILQQDDNYVLIGLVTDNEHMNNYLYMCLLSVIHSIKLNNIKSNIELNNKLIEAVLSNNYKKTVEYIQKGANINCRSNLEFPKRFTPLAIAISNKNFEIVKYLLENEANIYLNVPGDIPPLTIATMNNSEKIIKLLLLYGADYKHADITGKTAKEYTDNKEILSILTEKNPQNIFNLINNNKINEEFLNKLNEDDFYINIKDAEGNTLLHSALKYNHLTLIDILIKKGIDINAKNRMDFDAYTFANLIGNKTAANKILTFLNKNKKP